MDKTVELYEDNAGHLYMTDLKTVWSEMEQLDDGMLFGSDATAIQRGDTDEWTIASEPYTPEFFTSASYKCIAAARHGGELIVAVGYDGLPIAGIAGRRYLGLKTESEIFKGN